MSLANSQISRPFKVYGRDDDHDVVSSNTMNQMMKLTGKQNVSIAMMPGMGHWVVVALLCVLVSACASSGGQKAEQESKSSTSAQAAPSSLVRSGCSGNTPQGDSLQSKTPQGQAVPADSNQAGMPPQNCLPKGVIEITENYPVDPEVRGEFQQALALLKEEKYSEAIRLLKAVTGKAGKFTGPHINLGIAYLRSGELEKAEESLKKALELNAYHPVAMNELALVYRKTGRYTEARELYESLVNWYPDFLPARKNLGVLCDIYIQDLNCALDQYEAYLEGVPEDEKVKIWVADVKSRM